MTATTSTDEIAALRAAVRAAPGPGGSSPRLILADALDAVGVVTRECEGCRHRIRRQCPHCSNGVTDDYPSLRRCLFCDGRGFHLSNCAKCGNVGLGADHSAPIEAALQRVLAEPERDEHRLNYAAAVEPVDKDLAQFVRLHMVYLGACAETDLYDIRQVDNARAAWLSVADHMYWRGLREIGGGFRVAHTAGYCPADRRVWKLFGPKILSEIGTVEFDRGLIGIVRMTAADWETHAPALRELQPIRLVRFTTRPLARHVGTGGGWDEHPDEPVFEFGGRAFSGRELRLGEADDGAPWTDLRHPEWMRHVTSRCLELLYPGVGFEPPK